MTRNLNDVGPMYQPGRPGINPHELEPRPFTCCIQCDRPIPPSEDEVWCSDECYRQWDHLDQPAASAVLPLSGRSGVVGAPGGPAGQEAA